jgi:hypothetical protein
MTVWTSDELDTIGNAEELRLATQRADGTLRNPVTIWVVRHGDDLYIRSYRGPDGSWFRHTRQRRDGHIQTGGSIRTSLSPIPSTGPGNFQKTAAIGAVSADRRTHAALTD